MKRITLIADADTLDITEVLPTVDIGSGVYALKLVVKTKEGTILQERFLTKIPSSRIGKRIAWLIVSSTNQILKEEKGVVYEKR